MRSSRSRLADAASLAAAGGSAAAASTDGRPLFLGLPLDLLDRRDLVASVVQQAASCRPLALSFLDPYYCRLAVRDPQLARDLAGFDLQVAGGWGVVYAARLSGLPVPGRAVVEDLEPELFDALHAAGLRVFLLGGAPGVAARAAQTVHARWPGLVAGSAHGHLPVAGRRFRSPEQDELVSAINESGARVLLVGLSTPLQQAWISETASDLQPPVVVAVGGYLDKLAERLAWFPPWAERLRLEWLYRSLRDPRRLGLRYLVTLLVFPVDVVRLRSRTRRAAAAGVGDDVGRSEDDQPRRRNA